MHMQWRKYVPVSQRKAQAARHVKKIAKKRGFPAQPITNLGRKITKTFWGNAWCENLESYGDFENRIPRGRTYARNGSIVDLVISKGRVKAIVGGSDIYKIDIKFSLLKKKQWETIKQRCAGSIDSVMSLLQGRFDESVMTDLSRQKEGLFPTPSEIDFDCDCPDWASMCKHIAAVLYGIGARLDDDPGMLFLLRGVDHLELITSQSHVDLLVTEGADSSLDGQDLSHVFGIEFDTNENEKKPKRKKTVKKKAPKNKPIARKKAVKKKATKKKPVKKKVVKKKVTKKKAANKKVVKKKAQPKKKPAKKRVVKKKSLAAKN